MKIEELIKKTLEAVANGDDEELKNIESEVDKLLEKEIEKMKKAIEEETDPTEKEKMQKIYEMMKKDYERLNNKRKSRLSGASIDKSEGSIEINMEVDAQDKTASAVITGHGLNEEGLTETTIIALASILASSVGTLISNENKEYEKKLRITAIKKFIKKLEDIAISNYDMLFENAMVIDLREGAKEDE